MLIVEKTAECYLKGNIIPYKHICFRPTKNYKHLQHYFCDSDTAISIIFHFYKNDVYVVNLSIVIKMFTIYVNFCEIYYCREKKLYT